MYCTATAAVCAHPCCLLDIFRYTGRSPNIRFEHLLYRASDGQYLPAIAVYTTTEVAQGELGGPQLRGYHLITAFDAAPMLLDHVLLGTAAAGAADEPAAA
jgi:hypothetical protein